MLILVANLGSTSFKYKLFSMCAEERVLAWGAADRIGQAQSAWSVATGDEKRQGTAALADHGAAIDLHLAELVKLGALSAVSDLNAIGFKAVHGGPIQDPVLVDDHVLAIQQQFADVAPAHNPPYIAAMKAFKQRLPGVPQVAAFETGFHQTIPLKRQVYAIPHEWTELGIRRYGFHGASHRYIATRMAELSPGANRIISCHLGGSCSICAIEGGKSVGNSFGMTAQSGVPHASRVGDFDAFALMKLLAAGIPLENIWKRLGKEGGLLGMSGVSPDLRDIEAAAEQGNDRAQLAIDVFVESVRGYIGQYLVALEGAETICFTGGIGQHSKLIRREVLKGLQFAGIAFDAGKNEAADGNIETRIDSPASQCEIWVLPTNEELIVARQTLVVLEEKTNRRGAEAQR